MDKLGRLAVSAALASNLAAMAGLAAAQSPAYPAKPIRILVGYEPGGPNDTQARLVGAKIGESMGQSVVVDNKPGADGIIANEMVTRSPADGYTLVLVSAGHAINPNFVKSLPYHPVNDFAPVTQVSAAPFVLVVHPSVPVNTTQEFINYVKANPGKLNYGSSGNASSLMMTMELFKSMAGGLQINHIPYKGGAPATADLLAGRVHAMTNNVVSSIPNARAGKLRALAVTSARRMATNPDLPTVGETLPGFEVDAWYGILSPKGTPAPVVNKLQGEIVKAMAQPDVRERFTSLGLQAVGSTPAEFTKRLQKELVMWAKVVKDSGVKTD
jgi:tripartite-type tricarboxylate transporter receptor subunit TctC